MVNPFAFEYFAFLYLWNAFTTFGFSILQGPHQDAQKSIKTIFPLKEESGSALPSAVFNLISGARFPISVPTGSCCAEIREIPEERRTTIKRAIFFIILVLKASFRQKSCQLACKYSDLHRNPELSNPCYACSQSIKSLIDSLVSPVDLFNIMDYTLSFGRHGSDQQSDSCPDIR